MSQSLPSLSGYITMVFRIQRELRGTNELVKQIELEIAVEQKIDYDHISLEKSQNMQSYISFDQILVESEVVWNNKTGDTMSLLHGVATIDAEWIDTKFGEGINVMRNRVWLRF